MAHPPSQLAHGLTAGKPPAGVVAGAMALADRGELVRQAESLFDIGAWIAHELHAAPVLSRGERLSMLFADCAGRANETAAIIANGEYRHRARGAQQRTRTAPDAGPGVARQATITGYLLTRTRGAAAWLRTNGVLDDAGAVRPVLNYFAEYLERSRRNVLLLAAALPADDDDAPADYERILENERNGHDTTN